MFEWLLKYPLSTFQDAEWIFESGRTTELLVIVMAIVGILIMLSLWRVARRIIADSTSRPRLLFSRLFGIGLLQTLFAGVLLLMFWQPALKVDSVAAGDNSVALLVDHSRSMYFDDSEGTMAVPADGVPDAATESSRLGRTLQAIESSDLFAELGESFELKLFRLDAERSELKDADALLGGASSCLLYTSPSPRDATLSRMPSSA